MINRIGDTHIVLMCLQWLPCRSGGVIVSCITRPHCTHTDQAAMYLVGRQTNMGIGVRKHLARITKCCFEKANIPQTPSWTNGCPRVHPSAQIYEQRVSTWTPFLCVGFQDAVVCYTIFQTRCI